MAILGSQRDNEQNNFVLDSNGNVCRRVCATDALPVTLVSDLRGDVVNTFGTVASVASSSTVTVVTYTVPALKKFFLRLVEASGENIAKYDVEVDGSPIARRRVFFGSEFSLSFDFSSGSEGISLSAGQVVRLRVENFRPSTADFEGRILGVLDDA